MFALTTVLTGLLALPQGPGDVLATYQLEGKPAAVTHTDVALEMAFHLRRRERGQQAVDHLVAKTITSRIATAKKLMPDAAEVRAAWRELQEQLRAAGRRPEEFPAMRNSGEAQWLDDLGVHLAQERIVRAELHLAAKEPVNTDMLKLWLQEERKKADVVSDPDLLPAGTAVRIGTTEVPLIDLGLLLLRTAEDDEREKYILQVAYLQTIEALARREQVQITPSDLDNSLQKRKDDAERDPRYRGVSFENMLKAMGLTSASLRELRTFRAQILLDKIAQRRVAAADLQQELETARQTVLDRVGPRRRIGLIFVRASDEPNGLITRTFDAAKKHLEVVRARLQKETWENTARIESEHAGTKMQGGDTGWHRRRSDKLPDEMLAAAFALPAGEVSMPLRSPEGCYLVKALEVEPDPADEVLLQRLREFKAQELEKQLLADAKVEMLGKANGKPAKPGGAK